MSTLTQFYANPSPALACELADQLYSDDTISPQLRKAAEICRQHDELVAALQSAIVLLENPNSDAFDADARLAEFIALIAKVQA